jgi:Domain of unknown function (DUF4145)
MTTESPKRIKAHCPKCGPERWADIKARYHVHDEHGDSGVWTDTKYYILQCPACETVYFLSDSVFSEDKSVGYNPHTGEEECDYDHTIEQWPSPSRRELPGWLSDILAIDHQLHRLLLDTYRALDNDLRIFAAIGVRTTIDRISEFLGIDPSMRFDEKLSELLNYGRIGRDEYHMLDALTDAGSAAAHRGWMPSTDQLDTMMASIEGFIYRTYILGAEAKKLKTAVPPRAKKAKKPEPPAT